MIKFSFKENGAVVEKEFRLYPELVLFVAQNRIKDEDFVSLQLSEDSPVIEGLDGLANVAIASSTAAIEAIEAMEAEENEEEFEDECEACKL